MLQRIDQGRDEQMTPDTTALRERLERLAEWLLFEGQRKTALDALAALQAAETRAQQAEAALAELYPFLRGRLLIAHEPAPKVCAAIRQALGASHG